MLKRNEQSNHGRTQENFKFVLLSEEAGLLASLESYYMIPTIPLSRKVDNYRYNKKRSLFARVLVAREINRQSTEDF